MKRYFVITFLVLALTALFAGAGSSVAADRQVKVGILYEPWQCMFSDAGKIYDISEILAGRQAWGPVLKYYWTGKPELGYYCLTRDRHVLVKHAEMLRDAGVDFVAIDTTNSFYATYKAHHSVYNNPWWDPLLDPVKMVQQPIDALLEVWSAIPGAPKVVPFAPLKNEPPVGAKTITGADCPSPDMQVFWNERLNPDSGSYKEMAFIYENKPLWLASRGFVKYPAGKCLNAGGEHPYASDNDAIAAYSRGYTIREMWGLLDSPERKGYSKEVWSFKENCQEGFKDWGGSIACNQRAAFRNGKPEELSVSAAYQRFPGTGYISDKGSAVPKLDGNTLHQQFDRFWDYPNVPIVFVNSWNEWGAVRHPCKEGAVAACQNNFFRDGSGVFMDVYGEDYDASLEPSAKDGDKYYRQLVDEIQAIKSGEPPR